MWHIAIVCRAKSYRQIWSIRCEIIISRCAKVSCRETSIARKRATTPSGRKFGVVCRVALFRADKRPLQHVTIREIRALNPSNDQRQYGFDGRDGDPRREDEVGQSSSGKISAGTKTRDRLSCISVPLPALVPPSLALVSRSFRPRPPALRRRRPFAHEPGIRLVCALITLLEPSSSRDSQD